MDNAIWKSLGSILEEQFTEQAIRARPKRLKTGFPRLDAVLGGGIAPGLTVLGGSPSLGKSTFALQIAEHVSRQGTPVLYFSLEMSGSNIAAKSLSRQIFQTAGKAGTITAEQLTNGEFTQKFSQEQWAQIGAAHSAAGASQQLYLVEDPFSAVEIAEAVQDFMAERAEEGVQTAPLVVVDYLQILPWSNSARSEKQAVEESLRQMVTLARSGVPVLLISSLSRGGYKDPIRLDVFKESGGIEYSADVLLGLQFTACHTKGGWNIDAERNRSPRDVEVMVLKQRYGRSGSAVRFQYYAQFDCFVEAGLSAPAVQPEAPAAETPPKEQAPAPEASAEPLPRSAAAPEEVPGPADVPPDPPLRRGTAFYINNTKIANDIRGGRAAVDAPVFCKVFGQKNPLTTRYQISQRLSGYDCAVADALYTLYRGGHDSFSHTLLLGTLSGDSKQTLTRSQKDALLPSLQRLLTTRLEIDCTQEMRERKLIAPEEEKVFSGPFLNAVPDGKGGYRFVTEDGALPLPLYAYSEMNSQMIRFPRQLLTVYTGDGKKMTNTLERVVLKRFLIHQLEILRNPHNKDKFLRSMSFARGGGTSWELGLGGNQYRVKTARVLLRTAQEILDYYRQIGYITGYDTDGDVLMIKGAIRDPWSLDKLFSEAEQ